MGLLTLYNNSQAQLNTLDPDLVTVYPSTVTGTPTSTANPGGPTNNFDPIYNANNTYLDNLPSLVNTGLNTTLNITNLDVENPSVQGGPINDITTQYPSSVTGTPTITANPGGVPQQFTQPYSPGSTYLDASYNAVPNNTILDTTLPITNLDVENPSVQGGPLSDTTTVYPSLITGTPTTTANPGGAPQLFSQPYLPSNTYLNSNPIQGIGSGKLDDSLSITNLDVENPGVNGGPLSDTTTQYPASVTGTPTSTANPGGVSTNFSQPYLPSNTYLDPSYNVIPSNTILDTTLPITNLDVEDPSVQGGPINDTVTVYPSLVTGTPTNNANPGGAPQLFSQPYLPSNTYLDTNPIQGIISSKLYDSLGITNLDVLSNGPNGFLSNDTITIYPPSSTGTPTTTANPGGAPQQYSQLYFPLNRYLDTSYNVVPSNTILSSSLNITNLDTEDPGVQGGIPYKPLTDPTIYPTTTTHTSAIRGYFAKPSQPALKYGVTPINEDPGPFTSEKTYSEHIKNFL
jgi:hypothetical protein